MKNNRYTLAVRRVANGDTASSVLAGCPGLLDDFDCTVKAVSVDPVCYDGTCLTLLQANNHVSVMPIVTWGTKRQTALSECSSSLQQTLRHRSHRPVVRVIPASHIIVETKGSAGNHDRISDILAEGLTLRDSPALDAVKREGFGNGTE